MAVQITPRPDYTYRPHTPAAGRIVITPNPDYKPVNLHSAGLPINGPTRTIETDWCPVCHGARETISERLVRGRPVWHCDVCGHEW